MYHIFQKLIQSQLLFSRKEVRLKISKASDWFQTLIVRNRKGYWQWLYSSDPLKPLRETEQGNIS